MPLCDLCVRGTFSTSTHPKGHSDCQGLSASGASRAWPVFRLATIVPAGDNPAASLRPRIASSAQRLSRGRLMVETLSSGIGISAIATYEPPWVLTNEWFGDTIPRKFVHHTGIESRYISLEDEVTMGIRAVKNLQREVG